MEDLMEKSKKKVAYFYSQEIAKFRYLDDHVMKPKRLAMTHSLINSVGLYKYLDVYKVNEASDQDLMKYHDPDFIKYLKCFITPIQKQKFESQGTWQELPIDTQKKFYQKKGILFPFNIGQQDCPEFDGLYKFCQLSAGASINAAQLLIQQKADICINWSGGLHHSKKSEASGFCYINDIVLCIIELLKFYKRVIYIDIDVHHGDGVEDAFYLTNRVMTLSFHQYGEGFFPGSGEIESNGDGKGKFHCINVPLQPGMNDEKFIPLFKDIVIKIMEAYQPESIVLQCGADSIVKDQLGGFNLSTKGHGECVKYILNFGIPTVLLGGGGYTVENVSRCWAYETSIALDKNLGEFIPQHESFYDHYAPDYQVHVLADKYILNKNTDESLHKIKTQIFQYLKEIEIVPSVPFHQPPDLLQFSKKGGNKIDNMQQQIEEQERLQLFNINNNNQNINYDDANEIQFECVDEFQIPNYQSNNEKYQQNNQNEQGNI